LKRILFALELGGNWGHFARNIPVALALRERGHELLFAVRNGPMAERLLGPHRLAFIPVGVSSVPLRPSMPPANYAEVLLRLGYARVGALHTLLCGWLTLLDHFNPDVVVADYAPTAMLAARLTSRPLVAIGLGYELPPPVYPLPSIRPWETLPAQRLVNSEAKVLAAINTAVANFRGTPLRYVHELLACDSVLLTTVPELDHFGPRPGGLYLGPIYSAPEPVLTARWPPTQGPRVLGYLHAQTDGLYALLGALNDMGASILCIPGAAPGDHEVHTCCQVYSNALHLDPLLSAADLVITNGNLTTSARALLAGVPVLALPHVIEQQLGALRIASLGAGLMAGADRTETVTRSLLRRLCTEESFRRNARQFAARYAGQTSTAAAEHASDCIEGAAR
jgi:UDP:flavonoid glycosyltransferase YjiC (YdhE family)